MFDDLTLVDVNLRPTDKGNVFDLSFECDLPGILNITFTLADEEDILGEFVAQIVKTYDGRSAMEIVVDAVLSKPELRPTNDAGAAH